MKNVKIEKDSFDDKWKVFSTDNGRHWWQVFSGEIEQCRIIVAAFNWAGYPTKEKEPA